MLTLHTVEFATDHRTALYAAITEHLSHGRRVLLIVPEQQTLTVEREAATRLDPTAPLLFEVTNFSRLANTAFRTVGGIAETYSDATAKALIMWRALKEASPLLTRRRTADITASEVSEALAALGEIESLGLGADALAEAAEDERLRASGRLCGKLRDLSVILSFYRRLHAERFADTGEEVRALADLLKTNTALFADSVLYIDGFTSFTEPQLWVLGAILGRADTTVYLTLPKEAADAFEYTETRRTAERLLRLADLANVPKRRVFSSGNDRIVCAGLYEMSRILWRQNQVLDKDCLQNLPNHLKIYEADTPFDGAEAIASFIKREVMERGASYRDFAILMRDVEPYLGVVDTALTEAGIPVFVSRKHSITTLEAVKLIDTAYRTVLGAFRREDVLAYAKCGLSGITAEACDALELYTERWRIKGEGFLREDMWSMNPDGYTDRWREGATEQLRQLDATRHALLDPIVALSEAARAAKTVREHAVALYTFLTDIGIEGALLSRAAELRLMGEVTAAEENERIYAVLLDTLTRTVDVMGELSVDTRAFHTLFMIGCSSVELGRIPALLDCVTVGAADMLRVTDKRHVILFGVHEGEFPAAAHDTAYFTERERAMLYAIGLTPEPVGHERAARELFYFSRAFTAASERVTLLTCRRSTSFHALRRAEVIRHITEATQEAVGVTELSRLPLAETIFTPTAALSRLGDGQLTEQERRTLSEALMSTPLAKQTARGRESILNDSLTLSPAMAEDMYGRDLALTQSRLEQFLACPLQHFCHFVLHLDDGHRASFDVMNIGTFIHSILEHFFHDVDAHGEDLCTLRPADVRVRVEALAKAYIHRLSTDTPGGAVRLSHLLRRLTRTASVITEGLVEELREGAYRPRFFELPIQRDTADAPAPVTARTSDGHGVYIYGTIDRVDTFVHDGDVYVRVVDYKTGRKKFSPSDLEKGHNLQMFLYLMSVVQSNSFRKALGVGKEGKVIPAGVIYAGTHLSDKPVATPSSDAEAAFKAAQTRSGMLLDDPCSLGAMNPDFLPFKLKKDGTPEARAKNKLYSEEGWESLCETVKDSVVRIAEGMKGGAIPAAPMKRTQGKSACEYCAYKPICRNARL